MSEEKKRIPRVSREVDSDQVGSRVFVGAPDYRVFVWGVDITHDIFSVAVTNVIDDGVSTAMFNVVNDNGKWILPTAIGVTPFEFFADESAAINLDKGILESTIIDTTSRGPQDINPLVFAKKKRENMIRLYSRGGAWGTQVMEKFSNSRHYPFLVGCPLIQAGDRVRIFLKNPWDMRTKDNADTGSEEWYFGFTGFVSVVTEDFDATTNRSILRVLCEDFRKLLRYMRITTNPDIFHLNIVTESLPDDRLRGTIIEGQGVQNVLPKLKQTTSDISMWTGNESPMAGQTIVDRSPEGRNGFLEMVLLGIQNKELAGIPGRTVTVDGVMGFSLGGKKVITLPTHESYEQAISQHMDSIYPILSAEQMLAYGRDWSLGSDPDVIQELGVDANRLWIILPDERQFPDLRYPFDWSARVSYFSEWRSRLDLINEFVKNLDCVWYTTPKGDIVFEFPHYDSIPQLYKEPWCSIFTIQNEFRNFSKTEDDRNIKTLTVATGSPVDQYDLSRGAPFLSTVSLVNPELVARYGVREQRSNRPFHYKQESVSSALYGLASMWQGLANADAFRLEGLECLPNFRAPVGRPYYFKYRNVIAFANMVQHQIVWGSIAQTVYSFRYVRHFDISTGSWDRIGGLYGWNWRGDNPPGNDLIVANKQITGAEPLSRQTPAPLRQAEIDPTAHILKQNLRQFGGQLSEQERSRALQIIKEFSSGQVSKDRRTVLLQEFETMFLRVGKR